MSDEQQPDPGHSTLATPAPQRPRRRWGGVLLLVVIAGLLAATFVTLRTPREATPTPIKTLSAEDAAASDAGGSDEGTSSEDAPAPSVGADAPPAADPAMEQVIARWATRESPEDQSWSDDLTGQIAPDAARRLAVQPCLPVDAAPLRVDRLEPAAEATQEGTTWSGDLALTVSDKDDAQTPLTVRAQAMWDEPTSTWMLTSLTCLDSGGTQ